MNEPSVTDDALIGDVRQPTDDARWRATPVDTGLSLLYWRVGRRIGREVLEGTGFVIESAMYGRTRASRV
jgi:hypothetical protein